MPLEELWQRALGEISVGVNPTIFNSWFKNAKLLEVNGDGIAVLSCHNNFTKEWLQEKCHKLILRALRNHSAAVRNVSYVVTPPAPRAATQEIRGVRQAPYNADTQLNLLDLAVDKETNLNLRYTFDNFIVGSHNELAHAAAMSVVEKPGARFNPLFIYGGTGLGKTHILHAIGNELRKRNPQNRIKYVTSEKFTEEVVRGMRNQTLHEVKEKYRPLDTLLMDDVQFLSCKEKTQEELFHTFNVLADKNKQVVFSSDRPPQAIHAIEERLLSRFSGGMQADIKAPDFETRVIILKAKLNQMQSHLDESVIELIARKIQKNIRELEGALNRIISHINLKNEFLSSAEAERILDEAFSSRARIISPKHLIRIVAEFYAVPEKDLVAKSRKKDVVKPRQIAMYLLREDLRYSFPSIGEKFGGRDHTTVMHACGKISKELQNDSRFASEIASIKEKMLLS